MRLSESIPLQYPGSFHLRQRLRRTCSWIACPAVGLAKAEAADPSRRSSTKWDEAGFASAASRRPRRCASHCLRKWPLLGAAPAPRSLIPPSHVASSCIKLHLAAFRMWQNLAQTLILATSLYGSEAGRPSVAGLRKCLSGWHRERSRKPDFVAPIFVWPIRCINGSADILRIGPENGDNTVTTACACPTPLQ